jgi:hypothetical protein
MLISDIILEVIDEVGGDQADTGLVAKMLTFAKGALRRFPLFCRERLISDVSYATLLQGSNYLTTPTGFIRETGEDSVYYEDSGARKIITKLPAASFSAQVNTNSIGKPEYYRIVSNVMEFDKKADSDIVIFVEHFQESDIVTPTTDFFGNTSMQEILKDGMKYTYYSDYVEDPVKGKEKLALFQTGLEELESKYMMSEHGGHIGD